MPLLIDGRAIADRVRADGLPRQAGANDGSTHVLYLEGDAVLSMLAADWPPPLPTEPTEAESAQAVAARAVVETQRQADAVTLRQRVRTLAQSAVGQPFDALTGAQVRALLAILLHKEGALNKDGVVRPLSEWVK